MSTFAFALVPSVTKAIIKLYLGSEAADIGGTALTVALKIVKDKQSATSAEKEARKVATQLVEELEIWLEREVYSEQAPEYWAAELSDSLEHSFSTKAALDAALDPNRISSAIVEIKAPDWELAGADTAAVMPRLVSEACRLLVKVVPGFSDYGLERDRKMLGFLELVAGSSEQLLRGQRDLAELLMSVQSASVHRPWEEYEISYRNRIAKHLDYVEILGLGLKTDKRTANLSVAYLSLTFGSDDPALAEGERTGYQELLETLPWRGNRLVIEGGAGSGKSTLLRWTAIRCARPSLLGINPSTIAPRYHRKIFSTKLDTSIWGAKSANLRVASARISFDLESEIGLRDTLSKAHPLEQRVPFLIRLRDLKSKEIPKIEELPRLLFDLGEPPEGWVQNVLSEGRAVVLFDGVDEVTEERGTRARVLAAIKNFSETYPDAIMIVAGRPGAFSNAPFGARPAVEVTVNDMDDEEREEFVTRWHRARSDREVDPAQKAKVLENSGRLKAELQLNSALRRMAANPLLAASICALHDISPSTTPRTEYEVCERLAKMLVNERDLTEDEQGGIVDLSLFGRAYDIDYADKQTIISRIAGQMLSNGDSILAWSDAMSVVNEAMFRINRSPGLTAKALLSALAIRSGVLRKATARAQDVVDENSSSDAIEFVHNRFKEWFASIDFLNRNQPVELANKLPEDPYDQISVFAVSAAGGEHFSNRLVERLKERLPSSNSSTQTRQMKLTAVRLNEAARLLTPQLKDWAISLHSEMFPPRSKTEAKALSLLGDMAVPYLTHKMDWGAREAAAAAMCLRLIGTAASLNKLETYLVDPRWTVGQEASVSFDPLRSSAVLSRILHGGSLGDKIAGMIRSVDAIPKNVKRLELAGTALSSLEGFESFTALSKINISNTAVSDISPIRNIKTIKDLNISRTGVSNIDHLAGLSDISTLDLSYLRLESIVPLVQLSLLNLDMQFANVGDYSPLSLISTLKAANFVDSGFSDCSYLENSRSMEFLNISNTGVQNIYSLARMDKLKSLFLSSTKVVDFSPIAEIKSLQRLYMAGCTVKDLDFCKELSLQWLLLDGSSVEDISGLRGMKSLTRLDLDGTKIKDINPLADIPNLATLYITGVQDIDMNVIYSLPKIRQVHFSRSDQIDFGSFISNYVKGGRGIYQYIV